MPIDFRADQVQTNKIIVTGSTPQNTLLIYGIGADGSPPNQGIIKPSIFDTGSIGTDVFLFVSGVIGGKDGTDAGITVIGGDLHISGNLSIDGTGGGGGWKDGHQSFGYGIEIFASDWPGLTRFREKQFVWKTLGGDPNQVRSKYAVQT